MIHHNMKRFFVFCILLVSMLACNKGKNSITGSYEMGVNGVKNVSTGMLEIVGEHGDYFGRITFNSKKKRVYEIGLLTEENDSLNFILPGNGGFLKIGMDKKIWRGRFKYFGIEAKITVKKVGAPTPELEALVDLKPLAKGVISTDSEESFPSFDATAQVLYFTRGQSIYSSELVDSIWQEPKRLPFSQDSDDSAPYIFNNGNSILFTSNRPVGNSKSRKKNLWTAHKSKNIWSTPEPLPSPINVDSLGDYHGAAVNANKIYFISYNRDGGYGRSDLYSGEKDMNGAYNVSNLGEHINSELSEADVFIHPDEKYLLFASTGRKDGFGADDIYISFRRGADWGKPINLCPKVNSYAYEYGAWADEQNDYLYFNSFRRGTSDIYRVRLEELEIFSDREDDP